MLLPNLAADPVLARRFDREARALAAAAHPNVVSVFDVEHGDPAIGREPFYVMELCDGGSLADRIAQRGSTPPRDVVATIAAVADGLAELHRRGFVHRDVKPHNILYCGGRAKLADFGVATGGTTADTTALTAAGTTMGTLAYLAPELLTGAAATPASDVYALGVVAFQALTGRLPRTAASITDVVESRTTPPPTISSVAPALGSRFDGPVASALAIEPAARPTPVAFAQALERAIAAEVDPGARTVAVPIVAPRAARDARAPRRTASTAALLALALLIAALIGIASMLRGGLAPGTSPGASAALAATPSPTASPSPTPSPTPTPRLSPVPDPAAAALTALNDVYTAIQLADRNGGLKGKDVNDLVRRANAIRDALRRHDYEAAANAADDLIEHLDHVDRLRDSDRSRIADAVSTVIDAIPEGD